MKQVLLLLLCVVLTACAAEPAPAETPPAEEPAAALDEAGARSIVQQGHSEWIQAAMAGDAAAMAGLYTDDAHVMPPNMAAARGRAAVESMFAELFETTQFKDIEITLGEVGVPESGEFLYSIGTYRDTIVTGGQEINESGSFIAIHRQVDGQWKLAADIWNSDQPM